ncbi:hypothetical protein DAPPUDRAFT_95725 [Daphnia pulex]|uniref:Uncharacterized protein n=1 Tax=Daphnia pulex TaxID=6669 RepID=E9FUK2_DAPPU|nr:hypothetical protein DAPPUDRAFT_95725 [Daphnia pulex]|eukprot:EFX88908.1 hypothetical protein DAPPUDRAFT_95725 [Daphnia pulex]
MGFLVGMICAAVRTTFTNQSDLDVTEPDELQDQNASYSMTECLIIPEEEQGTEGTTHVFSFPSELDLIKPCLHEPGVAEPLKDTIIPQNEPFPDCSEDSSPPVTHAEDYPGSISLSPSPTDASCYPYKQNEDESAVAQNIFQKQMMMTHSTNAAKSFQSPNLSRNVAICHVTGPLGDRRYIGHSSR